jgi:two-component system sensor histidine kinase ChvG
MIANQRKATLLALVAAAVTAGFVAWTLTRRLRRLMRAARRTADGAPFDADIGGGDEIGELAGSIREMASSIEERNGYNRDFVSTTIHELRAPLTAIQGAVELLEQGAADNPAARAKFLGNIRHQTERMVRLVGELRELTRLDSELMSSRKEVVSYVPFLRETLERLEQTFEPPRATCRFDPPEDDIRAAIVPGKIEQVLVNLLENAFRYTPADGSVTVEVRCVGGTVETAVRDSGSGIAPANLGRVFDRFFTTERRDRAAEHGSGLGLWIARRIVESHGGAIRAENAQGGGALLTFSLPLA